MGSLKHLVVVGLFLLIAVVGLATVVMVRREPHNDGRLSEQTCSLDFIGPSAPALVQSQPLAPALDRSDGESAAGGPGAPRQSLRICVRKPRSCCVSAQSARAEAEEESRARRTELRELRADLERREQRLSDREERLDADVRGLEDKTRQLEELKNELKNQRRTLADLETEQHSSPGADRRPDR